MTNTFWSRPINIRLAYSFLRRGVGIYHPDNCPYDKVMVTEIEDLQKLNGAFLGVEYGAIMRVTFYSGTTKSRWIDFSMLATGGSSSAELTLLENQNND